jgi:hypothetical protein
MDTATSDAANQFVDVTDGPEGLDEASGRQPDSATDRLSIENGVASARQPKKKVNPLVDLIETEKAYVDLLAAIIRKVAAAWSRSNFPPPELDAMFRSVEVVCRANRSLLAVSSLSSILLESSVLQGILWKLTETERNWPQAWLPESIGRPPNAMGASGSLELVPILIKALD